MRKCVSLLSKIMKWKPKMREKQVRNIEFKESRNKWFSNKLING